MTEKKYENKQKNAERKKVYIFMNYETHTHRNNSQINTYTLLHTYIHITQ